jgi:hypothetical protein
MPELLHVTERCLVERQLAVLFENQMAFSQSVSSRLFKWFYISNTVPINSASAEAIAHIYTHSIGNGIDVSATSVWHTFYLHALLRDAQNVNAVLTLPHRSSDAERFSQALSLRNDRMVGIGQELWAHACSDCCKFVKESDGTWCEYLPSF